MKQSFPHGFHTTWRRSAIHHGIKSLSDSQLRIIRKGFSGRTSVRNLFSLVPLYDVSTSPRAVKSFLTPLSPASPLIPEVNSTSSKTFRSNYQVNVSFDYINTRLVVRLVTREQATTSYFDIPAVWNNDPPKVESHILNIPAIYSKHITFDYLIQVEQTQPHNELELLIDVIAVLAQVVRNLDPTFCKFIAMRIWHFLIPVLCDDVFPWLASGESLIDGIIEALDVKDCLEFDEIILQRLELTCFVDWLDNLLQALELKEENATVLHGLSNFVDDRLNAFYGRMKSVVVSGLQAFVHGPLSVLNQ